MKMLNIETPVTRNFIPQILLNVKGKKQSRYPPWRRLGREEV
jgi:hypothetical protein